MRGRCDSWLVGPDYARWDAIGNDAVGNGAYHRCSHADHGPRADIGVVAYGDADAQVGSFTYGDRAAGMCAR